MSLICGFNNDRISKILPQLNTITEEVYNHIHEVGRNVFQKLSVFSIVLSSSVQIVNTEPVPLFIFGSRLW